METKKINPMHVLYFSTETKINDIAQYVGVIGERLKKDAEEQNIKITGPQSWMYYDFTGEPDAFFTLEIAFPIDTLPENYSGAFAVKTLDEYKCLSTSHEGDWMQIPNTYDKLMTYVKENSIEAKTNSREVYSHVDMENPENNKIEIQLGIN
ncbi:MAG: GyrI-like domain-containing protein [bacterium]